MMYIEAYYSRGAESKDASVITGESHSPDHSSDISPDQGTLPQPFPTELPLR